MASVISLVWSLALFVFAEPLARLFLPKDAVAAAHAVAYVRIVSLCLVPQCWEVVLDGAFGGAGMTIPPMIITMTMTAARVPLARWAAFDLGLGVAGIWWVIAATAALRGVATALWFAHGGWKTRRAA
jgi:Na+-driven multidrug efflux pump